MKYKITVNARKLTYAKASQVWVHHSYLEDFGLFDKWFQLKADYESDWEARSHFIPKA